VYDKQKKLFKLNMQVFYYVFCVSVLTAGGSDVCYQFRLQTIKANI